MASQLELDVIYDSVDELARAGNFVDLDGWLQKLSLNDQDNDCLLAWLTATLSVKTKLPGRVDFVCRVTTVLMKRGEKTSELLKGLV